MQTRSTIPVQNVWHMRRMQLTKSDRVNPQGYSGWDYGQRPPEFQGANFKIQQKPLFLTYFLDILQCIASRLVHWLRLYVRSLRSFGQQIMNSKFCIKYVMKYYNRICFLIFYQKQIRKFGIWGKRLKRFGQTPQRLTRQPLITWQSTVAFSRSIGQFGQWEPRFSFVFSEPWIANETPLALWIW